MGLTRDLVENAGKRGPGSSLGQRKARQQSVGLDETRYQVGTRAKARIGEPVPSSIFSGAAIRIAPLGGN